MTWKCPPKTIRETRPSDPTETGVKQPPPARHRAVSRTAEPGYGPNHGPAVETQSSQSCGHKSPLTRRA
eukprot:4239721-Prymnesium_polylepis.1